MYDLIIIGGGPGGVAAGVYAARKKIKSLLITDTFGGQSFVSADVQNWIGIKSISGFDLAKNMEEHLRAQEDIDIWNEDMAATVKKQTDGTFAVITQKGKTAQTKYLLLTSGSRRRKLNVPGEKELDGRGVAYCSICDAPVFRDKTVAVVGGGNAGLEAVIDLFPYATKIYLLEYNEQLKGDPLTREKIKNNPKLEIMTMTQTMEIVGEKMVVALRYKDRRTEEIKELKLEGVFVEIGAIPNSDFVKDLVTRDAFGYVMVDHKTQATSCPGIWAAGDVSDVLYKQNNISMGDAIKAVLNIYEKIAH